MPVRESVGYKTPKILGRPSNRRVKLKRDVATEPPVITMFRQRMKREHRSAELDTILRAVMSGGKDVEELLVSRPELAEFIPEHLRGGMAFNSAMRQVVMPAMGFVDDQAEIRLYREHQRLVHHISVENAVAVDADEERVKTEEQEYEDALMTLPPNAPKAKELEWIEAHPAMMRQSRLQAGVLSRSGGLVILTARDILSAPHGPCPSRSAANQLQHWVNHSQKFFEQIMSEAKKKSTGDGAGGDGANSVEDNFEDIDASLAQHGL
jgi:hypothetical protein